MLTRKRCFLILWIILAGSNFFTSVAQTQQHFELVAEFSVGFNGENNLAFSDESGGQGPTSIATDINNNIYILDNLNYRIMVLDSIGTKIKDISIKSELGKGGQDINVDKEGNIYILDRYPPFRPDILQKIGDVKKLAKKMPAQMRIYNKVGQLIETMYLNIEEMRYAPNFIYGSAEASSVGFLRRTYTLDVVHEIQRSSIKVKYSNTSPAILGTPINDAQNTYFVFKKDKERTFKDYPEANRFNYIIFEDVIKNYDKILPPQYSFVQFLFRDVNQNIYLEVASEVEFINKNSTKNHQEIYKFNKNGELITKFIFPRNLNRFFSRQFAVSNNGDIYYLYLNDQKDKFRLLRVK